MKIIECPRDAMQGVPDFISTDLKAEYINHLLRVGFDTIDFGSFVSPKAIPQMKDTEQVLSKLDLNQSQSKLLAIIANQRGAHQAVSFDEIQYLGFPLSVSATFQQRNTNKTIDEAFELVESVQTLCLKSDRTLVVYLSMGFGNPYHEPFSPDIVRAFIGRLAQLDIGIISISDTIGVSTPILIKEIFDACMGDFPAIEFGAHLHSTPATAQDKIAAVFESGCRRMDGALNGFGGCPMAKDELTGNIATEKIISALPPSEREKLNLNALGKAQQLVPGIFN
jgi:hydroxymethylglutaryl-CoA lyase